MCFALRAMELITYLFDGQQFYRSNRDYGGLLEDGDPEEDEHKGALEETEGEQQYRQRNREMTPPEDEHLSQECQEYFERRQKFKELERQKLRKSLGQDQPRSNGSERKKLPYDNYGSFFGPSEPIVARRVIEDAHAREEAEALAARMAKEASERHAKGTSGPTRLSTSDSRPIENLKQAKSRSEAALRAQRLKEARDYSFLFTDEDPTAALPPNEASTKRNDKERTKQPTSQALMGVKIQQKGPTSMKSGSGSKLATSKLPVSYEKVTMVKEKSPIGKQSSIGDRNSKPAVLPPNSKVSSGMAMQSNKLACGPGRPSQGSLSSSIVNGKEGTTAIQSQARKVEPAKSGGVQTTKGGKLVPCMVASSRKMLPVADAFVKKTPVVFMEQNKVSSSSARPPVGGRRPAGHSDQRRPVQVVGPSKQVTKPVTKTGDIRQAHKRPRDSESDDSFLDDDDDGAGDVSSMIRKMFGYNPNKYRDIDDEDDPMMVAGFETIQQEEKKSARIAREEDERELALIEEEERRERARAKARKLKQR